MEELPPSLNTPWSASLPSSLFASSIVIVLVINIIISGESSVLCFRTSSSGWESRRSREKSRGRSGWHSKHSPAQNHASRCMETNIISTSTPSSSDDEVDNHHQRCRPSSPPPMTARTKWSRRRSGRQSDSSPRCLP